MIDEEGGGVWGKSPNRHLPHVVQAARCRYNHDHLRSSSSLARFSSIRPAAAPLEAPDNGRPTHSAPSCDRRGTATLLSPRDALTETNLQYLIQCFAGLNYNYHHHPYADIPGQPTQAPPTVSFNDPPEGSPKPTNTLTNGDAQKSGQTNDEKKEDEPSDKPHSRTEHAASLRELAQGLVLKEQQIEYLIQSLPGIGSSERDQERRIRELQKELRVVEHERREKEAVRERLVDELGGWLVGRRRVP